MSRRKIIVGVVAVVLVGFVGAGFWFFGTSQGTGSKRQETTNSQPATNEASRNVPALSASAANDLTKRMVSSDPAEFAGVWSKPAGLPMPPSGTSLTVHADTITTKETAAEAKATLVMPGQSPQEVNVYFEYIDGKWKIHHIQ